MSVFKCKFTYKKNVKNSRKSTKNLLVEHKFIDQYFNILDLNKFRQANTELSNEASEILNEKVRLFAEENGGKKALPYEDAFKKIDIVNSKKVELPGKDFDETLAARMQAKLQELYPEIKLNITNNPIWEKGDNIFNQEEFNNQVNFRLKAIEILSSDKAKQVFEKGTKNKWPLDKILSELQVPKEQKQLIEEVLQTMPYYEEIPFNEQIALALAETFGYAIEINTSLQEQDSDRTDSWFETEDHFYSKDFNTNKYYKWSKLTNKYNTPLENEFEITKEQYYKELNEIQSTPTQYYSNLTVPGGTNYTENEIATPAIIPNIKGHAQFATDQGIGWFRSDEQTEKNTQQKEEYIEYDTENGETLIPITKQEYKGGIATKTRRILEVQSDLFQKGRDKSMLVKVNKSSEIPVNKFVYEDEFSDFKTTFIKKDGKWFDENDQKYPLTEQVVVDGYNNLTSESGNILNQPTSNQFLQLLNKDNNWVTFFIKSIIQDSAKKGYEKVLFPSGNTASKVEGHTTLEEFKKQKEDRIKELESYGKILEDNKDLYQKSGNSFTVGMSTKLPLSLNTISGNTFEEAKNNALEKYKTEIAQLKQELERVDAEGFGALKPIYNFYENVVTSILKKQFGKENVKTITDEYGNTWNELTINQVRDLSNVMLQRNEANQIIGQANIKAMTVLIDAINQKQDTLPHEYAHHYIAWNRNTPIVQEAIKKWGSEEALVQAIGEQSVKQKGEAWSWWQKFVKWLLGDLSKLSKLDKERLTKILTDAFLTRQDLSTLGKPAEVKRIDSNVLQVNINSQEQFLKYLNNNKDKIIILESNSELSAINAPGIGVISNIPMDNVMTINTINSSKEELVESFENIDIELRADGTFDVVFINDNYGSQLKNSNPVLYTTLNTLLKNNFNFNNTNTDLIEAAENNDAQFEYQLTIDFSETADVLNNLTCK